MTPLNLIPSLLLLFAQPEASRLVGAHGLRFGMEQDVVVQVLMDRFGLNPSNKLSRNEHLVLEYGRLPTGEISRLRVFVHPERGVFWIEEEIFLRWNLQVEDRDNLEYHEGRLERVLNRLRQEYGDEVLLEGTDLGSSYSGTDFATATWSFPENRWIHLIYEPQDWGLYPEMYKIVVIYRDSTLDPRQP